MKILFPILATLLAFAASGCAPQVDVEAEAAAIREIDAQALAAAKAKNADGYLMSVADDALSQPPNTPMVTGKEAMRAFFSELFASPGFALDWQITMLEISSAGDLAYGIGTYQLTLNDAEGNPFTERGKWIAVWKKQPDGNWRAVANAWNSDQPAPSE